MKKNTQFFITTLLMFAASANILFGQETSKTITPVKSFGEINFATLAAQELQHPPKLIKQRNNELKEENQKGIPKNLPVPPDAKITMIHEPFVTNLSLDQPQAKSPAPVIFFNGLLDNNQVVPPDVFGSAGPNHLMETLNSQYRIFSKTGSTISTLSLNGFWSGLTNGSPYSDPQIVYDATTSRWFTSILASLNNGHYGIFVAASQTSDPTGSWYEYSVDTGPSATLPDYPLIGYNQKWVVITTNDFKSVFDRVRIIVYNKANLISGTLGTVNTFFDGNGLFGITPAVTMDTNQPIEYMLNNYNGNSGGNGFVRICTITGSVNSPVYTAGATVGINQPWTDTEVDAPQKGTANLIDANSTKMRTVVIRNGSLWATSTVFLPANIPNRAAAQWWQIDPVKDSVIQFGRLEDPTAKYMASFSSLAVTANSDVLVGIAGFGNNIYASAAYAYRNHSDALNTLRSPYVYKFGLATYYKTFGGSRNRWGDYTNTCIDPVDGSFWTLQEFANTPANKWGTVWANVAVVAGPNGETILANAAKLMENKTVFIQPNPNKGAFNVLYKSLKQGKADIYVVSVEGSNIYKNTLDISEGINQFNIDLKEAKNGTYLLLIKNGDETKSAQLIINN